MGRISFFGGLVGNMSFYERSAINDAYDRGDAAMEVATAQGDAFGNAISDMRRTIASQAAEIKTLHSMLGVLAAVLRDKGVVDADMLDARLEAAIINAQEEVKQADNTAVCSACGKKVPKASTNMTETGLVCDLCLAQQQ